jgi:diaminopropionate ammonia-lyase
MSLPFFCHPQPRSDLEPISVGDPFAFHQRMPGYAATPLREAPELAAHLGIGKLWIKDESQRLGMPSFKILGASWATYRAVIERLGFEPNWQTIHELAAICARLHPLRLAAATDGNHGRAVARMARLLGFAATIFVPEGTAEARISAISDEGAETVVVDGSYDEAVRMSAHEAGPDCLVISDTSWPGYETVPRDVIAGYSTILHEVDQQLAEHNAATPDIVAVQIGVGALAAAVVGHYRTTQRQSQPRILGVEPISAACVLASMRAGAVVEVPGPHDSIMAGLNCGLPSLIAWPLVSQGIDLYMAVADQAACQAVRDLARVEVVAGETGAAGLAGLSAALSTVETHRDTLGATSTSSALVIITEGNTDPAARTRILASDCQRDCLLQQQCKQTKKVEYV